MTIVPCGKYGKIIIIKNYRLFIASKEFLTHEGRKAYAKGYYPTMSPHYDYLLEYALEFQKMALGPLAGFHILGAEGKHYEELPDAR